MKPMFPWTMNIESPGENQRATGSYGTTFLDGPNPGINPPHDPDSPETLGFSGIPGLYPEDAQVVITATREASVYYARDPLVSEEDTIIAAQEAAIAALGAWVDVSPHSSDGPISFAEGGYSYSELGVAYYSGFAEEMKFLVRIAPPYSGRAKLVYRIITNGSNVDSDVLEFTGEAQTSYMGITRCIPIPIEDPIMDDHWHYLLDEPITLEASPNTTRTAEILWANSYRPPAA